MLSFIAALTLVDIRADSAVIAFLFAPAYAPRVFIERSDRPTGVYRSLQTPLNHAFSARPNSRGHSVSACQTY